MEDPDLKPPIPADRSAEAGKPDVPPVQPEAPPSSEDAYAGVEEIDKAYWLACLDDAERAERPWRERGREIIGIYRNETRNARTGKLSAGPVTFNILYANTEVMLPAVYQKPPTAVVRSRFVTVPEPPPMPPPMLPGVMPPVGLGAPPGVVPPPPGAPPPASMSPGPAAPAPGGPIPPMPPPAGNMAAAPPGGAAAPPEAIQPSLPPVPPAAPPGPMMGPPPMGPPPGPQPAPLRPSQKAIDAAASVMERALQIVAEDEHSDAAVKAAIKDTLLPGRGVCRVRWKPEMKQVPVMAGDGVTPLPDPLAARGVGDNGGPPMEDVKVDEQVGDEYVFWEDLLVDPVRAAADTEWIAFRHLFTTEALEQEFAGSPQYEALKTAGRLGDLFKWTDESAAKSPVGGGSAGKTAENLGGHIKKAMVWEIWSRRKRQIIWFIREVSGLTLRVDPDILRLKGFYPIPVPLLAVTTTDSRIPRAYYDLYAKLADDLDEVSKRISRLTRQIKARGAYNSASTDIADILTADDNKMIPVDGVDMIAGGLQNHIWMVPIEIFVQALDKLFLAREQLKQAIYEIMGISDIMRGATKASETATAQRIKGSMGVSRLEDAKQNATSFVRDLLRLKAEIIGQNFDAATLERMTGEEVTPEVLEILRDDFQRTCLIDIETDSTIIADEQGEQQAMAQVMQASQAIMQGAQGLLMTGMIPPPAIMQLSLELLKMALHPVRYARPVIQLIDQLQEKLAMAPMVMPPPPMPPPGPVPTAGAGPPGEGGPPPGRPPPGAGNGASPPEFMM